MEGERRRGKEKGKEGLLRTDSGMSLHLDFRCAFDEDRARVVDAIEHRLIVQRNHNVNQADLDIKRANVVGDKLP